MMALTIGTLAPLHRSPLQQSSLHFVIFNDLELLNDLQYFSLHVGEETHPLENIITATSELLYFTSLAPQRS